MSTTTMDTAHSTHRLDFVMKFVFDEMETLWALSNALARELEPPVPEDPDPGNAAARRLALLLRDRLASAEFEDGLRVLMMGRKEA